MLLPSTDHSGCMQASASRGAFLIRLTAVFTPLVALAQGENSDRTVWIGSAVALLGGILITLGGSSDTSLQASSCHGEVTSSIS